MQEKSNICAIKEGIFMKALEGHFQVKFQVNIHLKFHMKLATQGFHTAVWKFQALGLPSYYMEAQLGQLHVKFHSKFQVKFHSKFHMKMALQSFRKFFNFCLE